MKINRNIVRIALLALALSGTAWAASEPRKNYPGPTLPDDQIALVVMGWGNGSVEHGAPGGFRANVAGIDGTDCPQNEGRGGGDPYCGLFVQMAPGLHTLKVRVVSDVTSNMLKQSWREQYIDGVPANLEMNVIYRLVPVQRDDETFTVSVEEACRNKGHNDIKLHWFFHGKEMPQGFVCPKD